MKIIYSANPGISIIRKHKILFLPGVRSSSRPASDIFVIRKTKNAGRSPYIAKAENDRRKIGVGPERFLQSAGAPPGVSE